MFTRHLDGQTDRSGQDRTVTYTSPDTQFVIVVKVTIVRLSIVNRIVAMVT